MTSLRLLLVAAILATPFSIAAEGGTVPANIQGRDGAATGSAARDGTPPLNPLASVDRSTLKNFVERPLFVPSRRPPAAIVPSVVVMPPPPPVLEQPPALRLLGVVEGDHSLEAIVRRDDTGRTETLRGGDRIGGWRVELTPAGLRVISGERAFDYALFRPGHQAGPVPVTLPWPSAPALAAREPEAADGSH